MAEPMKQGAVVEMAVNYFPSFLRSRSQAQMLGAWMTGTQFEFSEDLDLDNPGFGRPFAPRAGSTNAEYDNLRGLSPNNFAGLITDTMAQMSILEGISKPGVIGVLPVWDTFRRNRWMSKQGAIHRGALGQSVAYGVVIPGEDPLTLPEPQEIVPLIVELVRPDREPPRREVVSFRDWKAAARP